MKHLYMVLAIVLALVFAMAVTTPAGVLPGEDLDDPGLTGGGGVEDGDHPWGGDQTSGGGSTTVTQTYRLSLFSGYPAIDFLVNSMLITLTSEVATSPKKTNLQSGAQSRESSSAYRSERLATTTRFRPNREAR